MRLSECKTYAAGYVCDLCATPWAYGSFVHSYCNKSCANYDCIGRMREVKAGDVIRVDGHVVTSYNPESPAVDRVHRSAQQNVLLSLPGDAKGRKNMPVCTGVLDYFPAAIAEVSELSKVGNDQHNPGEPLHWARSKSSDHADCLVRHTMQRGTRDTDGVRHATKAAWRALALLQEEIEAEAGFVPAPQENK